jgi:hypothetical protein
MKNRFFSWPKASLESERTRYETCQEALAALTQPTSEYERRGKLKKSFVEYRGRFRKEIFTTLGELVEIDNSLEEQFDKLMLDAVRMWLTFCTQRCRLLIVVNGSGVTSLTDSFKLAKQGKLMFTTKPGLQRYGNGSGKGMTSGLDLEVMTVVVSGEVISPGD